MKPLCVLLIIPALITPPETTLSQSPKIPVSREQITLSFAPVVKQVTPAVINIYTKRRERVQLSPFFGDPFFNQFFGNHPGLGGLSQERVVQSLGSGVIIHASGLVVTSNHVISGASDIVVALADKREFKAKVMVADPSSDLAMLKLEAKESFPALKVVDSDTVEVGDLVLAVGNPFGVGQTVTSGIVSALSRSAKGVNDYDFFIQTDAAINPGNSGGALVNMRGELIGINTAIFSKTGGSLGIGFAIPSNMILGLLKNAQGDGTVLRPWLGAEYQDVTPEVAESLGMPKPGGVLVSKVFPGSPAAKAGLREGDVIVKAEGTETDSVQALRYRMSNAGAGDTLHFDLWRKGSMEKAEATLATPPEVPAREARVLKGQHPLNGVTVVNLSPRVAMELGLEPTTTGVVVWQSVPGSNFVRGDILREINRTRIISTRQLQGLLVNRSYGWLIHFQRGGQDMAMSVQR